MPTHWQHWTLCVVMVIIACARIADAQQAPRPGQPPPEAVLQLPELKVIAPARLSGLPLPPSQIPATVQIITGEELRQSGGATLQESLTMRVPRKRHAPARPAIARSAGSPPTWASIIA